MEMSMQASSRVTSDNGEPHKKPSIKDRLGPIRGASSEDRPTTTKSKRHLNEDSYDIELGKNPRREINSSRTLKDDRLTNPMKSPNRKSKWLVGNRIKYTLLARKK